ncbi:MAG: DEAD/DEAH box helicase [Clostridia bacterium]
MNFKQLGIIDPILKAVEELGYETPSEIQLEAIPYLIDNRDLLGCAQTGTGKTAAFAIPILQKLSKTKVAKPAPIRALILTPTRELAIQIEESFKDYGKYLPLKCISIFGGVSQKLQVEKLNAGADIVVATPGRLIDLHNQGLIHFDELNVFVLDEADRMLDMGFVNDVKKIIKMLPTRRQNLLFSATIPNEVKAIVSGLLNNFVTITVTPNSSTVESIEQSLYYVDMANKQKLLNSLLKKEKIESALVFCRTKHGADKIVKELLKVNIKAQAIHGNKSQNARQLALSNFKSREIKVLVATDIAARGIDINELSHVINYDIPNIPETYVHRIGRTGRAGLSGIAISFCMFDEFEYLKDIEKLIGQKIPVVENHDFPLQIRVATPKAVRQPRVKPKPKLVVPKDGNKGVKNSFKSSPKQGISKANGAAKKSFRPKQFKHK